MSENSIPTKNSDIRLLFRSTYGGVEEVVDLVSAVDFLQGELQYWYSDNMTVPSVVQGHKVYYENLLNVLNQVIQGERGIESIVSAHSLIKRDGSYEALRPGRHPLFLSAVPYSGTLKEMLLAGGDYSKGVSAYMDNGDMLAGGRPSADYQRGYLDAHYVVKSYKYWPSADLEDLRAQYVEILADVKHKLNEARSYAGKAVHEIDVHTAAYRDALQESIRAEEEERRRINKANETEYNARLSTFNALEETYRQSYQFRGPSMLWKDMASKYLAIGWLWILCLVAVSVASVFGLHYLLGQSSDSAGMYIVDTATGIIDPRSIRGISILLAVLSIIAYLIRTFTKLAISAFHMRRDAYERYTLTSYYLALMETQAAGPEERAIILQALFSRVDTGLLGKNDQTTVLPLSVDALRKQ